MAAIKNNIKNKSITSEQDVNKSITSKLDDLQACIDKLNNIIDKLINEKVVSYSSQHPYSYYLSQRSKSKEDPADTADPAQDALDKLKEED